MRLFSTILFQHTCVFIPYFVVITLSSLISLVSLFSPLCPALSPSLALSFR